MKKYIYRGVFLQSILLVGLFVCLLPVRIESMMRSPTFWEICAGFAYLDIICVNAIYLAFEYKKPRDHDGAGLS